MLIGKISEVIGMAKDDLYIEMLRRYGQRVPQLISVIDEGVPAIMRATQNHCTEVGESELNGKLFKHLAILRGSSEYNSKEMSLLDKWYCARRKRTGNRGAHAARNNSNERKMGA